MILKQLDPSPSNATDFRATGLIIIIVNYKTKTTFGADEIYKSI